MQHVASRNLRVVIPIAILSGQLDLPLADLAYLGECEFNGRRWPWVDPLRDINAAKAEVELGINSRQNIARERGKNFAAITAENKDDTEAMKKSGLLSEPVVEPVKTEDESE
jgi:capsid protein